MTAPAANPALRRKIAAHARPPPDRPDPGATAGTGFTRALRHAGAPFEGLGLRPDPAAPRSGGTLEDALAALPEGGLVAVLEGDGGTRGLIALSPGMVDALVEVQTTGRVEQAALAPRAVTRIDEALVRDFVDFTLAAFARETAALPGRDWPERMGYASRVRDRSQITLLLAEGAYLCLAADVGFEDAPRRAQVCLVLPRGLTMTAAGPAGPDPATPEADAAWCRAREAMLQRLPLPLEAVLMRLSRPLGEVGRLAVGDLVPFGPGDLSAVTLETGAGGQVAVGRLGKLGGQRAIRLPAAPAPTAAPSPSPSAALAAGAGTDGAGA